MELTTKKCRRCGETKGVECFGRDSKALHGLTSYCRQCSAQKKNAYRLANAEKDKLARAAYRLANAEKARLNAQAYRVANLDKTREKSAALKAEARKNLLPSYVTQVIKKRTGIPIALLYEHPELIETSATALAIKRALKQPNQPLNQPN